MGGPDPHTAAVQEQLKEETLGTSAGVAQVPSLFQEGKDRRSSGKLFAR